MTGLLSLNNIAMEYGPLSGNDAPYRVFAGLNFTLSEGERVAIVGRNGCGKSTLLRIMAKIVAPRSGEVLWAPGVTVSLLSLGLGFRNELTGRENAYLSCLLQGLSRQDARTSLLAIEDFCELGAFFDKPVLTYSAGMRARLGFAAALENRSKVILIDEVLSVGDKLFRDKARETLYGELTGDRGVVLVTHADGEIKRLCQRALLLEGGRFAAEGEPASVLADYAVLDTKK